jgi:hypothetical protein
VFAGAGSYASPVAFSHGFVRALTASAVLSASGAFVAALLPRRTPHMEVSAQVSVDRNGRLAGGVPTLSEPVK